MVQIQNTGGNEKKKWCGYYTFHPLTAAPFWVSAPRNLILAPNETGILTCRVGGDPKPKITWFINGVSIESE